MDDAGLVGVIILNFSLKKNRSTKASVFFYVLTINLPLNFH